MYLSSREKMILEQLLSASEEMTINDLAKEIAVSSRTIHRDLKGIEQFLTASGLQLTRKTGVGIQITGPIANREQLKRNLMTLTLQDFMAEERQMLILSTLYEASGPVKLFTLANELQVTVATISNDLLKLEAQLEDFQLSIIRRRGYGIELSGSEESKRRAISYTISKSLSEDEFLSLIKRSIQQKTTNQENTISERLLHLVDQEKVFLIEETIRDLNPELLNTMTDSAYVGLVVHLTLAIDRIQQGEKIEMAQDFLSQLKKEPEYNVAEKMIAELALRFDIDIPEAEIGYITMHLQGAKLRVYGDTSLTSTHLQIAIQTKQLIQEVEVATNFKLTDQAPLFEGLVAHLKPALYRIQQNMGIANPLLKNIRQDYEELYKIVQAACQKVFVDTKIPEEEVGFLVLHFGAAILGSKKEGNLTAYVVCSSGIGTSKMLATQLRQEIPEIEEIRNVSAFELSALPITESDLVISTIQLRDIPFEYIVVSPFLTADEIQQVDLFAKRKLLLQNKAVVKKPSVSSLVEITERMHRIHAYTETMAMILENFKLTATVEEQSLETHIQTACSELKALNIIENITAVTEALFEREALGGLGIPDTSLALFHAKDKSVLKPSFTIYALGEPMVMSAMDGSNIEVSYILLLLAPDPYEAYNMEILSLISSILIESEQSIALFQSGKKEKIHAYLGEKFEQFLHEKIKNV